MSTDLDQNGEVLIKPRKCAKMGTLIYWVLCPYCGYLHNFHEEFLKARRALICGNKECKRNFNIPEIWNP